jgi:hypothetical protein
MRKFLPYLIYTVKTDLDVHVRVFQKAVQTNGENNDVNIVNLFLFMLKDAI